MVGYFPARLCNKYFRRIKVFRADESGPTGSWRMVPEVYHHPWSELSLVAFWKQNKRENVLSLFKEMTFEKIHISNGRMTVTSGRFLSIRIRETNPKERQCCGMQNRSRLGQVMQLGFFAVEIYRALGDTAVPAWFESVFLFLLIPSNSAFWNLEVCGLCTMDHGRVATAQGRSLVRM